jgi:hypothetical protein
LIAYRLLLALLIVLGLALAPVSAAMAMSAQAESMAMTDMPDCPSKAQKTSKDCGCCDTKAACQDSICLAKCFKLNGQVVEAAAVIALAENTFLIAPQGRPPDSWPEPRRRPPRT